MIGRLGPHVGVAVLVFARVTPPAAARSSGTSSEIFLVSNAQQGDGVTGSRSARLADLSYATQAAPFRYLCDPSGTSRCVRLSPCQANRRNGQVLFRCSHRMRRCRLSRVSFPAGSSALSRHCRLLESHRKQTPRRKEQATRRFRRCYLFALTRRHRHLRWKKAACASSACAR